jgi:diphthamide synthase (EF-2-diphthine--ammonia ligase)
VKKPWLTEDWVGMILDHDNLKTLKRIAAENRMDLCGEEGEYHTLVLDGPLFQKKSCIASHSIRTKDPRMYIHIQEMALQGKATLGIL